MRLFDDLEIEPMRPPERQARVVPGNTRPLVPSAPVRRSRPPRRLDTAPPAPRRPARSLVEAAAAPGARGHAVTRHFVAQFLLVVAGSLLVLAMFNRLADPRAVFSSAGGAAAITAEAGDRDAKVRLLRSQPNPDFVLLGSSRMVKYDPRVLGALSGQRGFNAAISGSSLVDARVVASWLAERTPRGQRMPHIVLGLAPEDFRRQPTGAQNLRYPELARQLSGRDRLRSELDTKWLPLIQLGTTRDSLAVLGNRVAHPFGGDDDKRFRPVFRRDGYLVTGYVDRTLRAGKSRWRVVERSRRQYTGFYERRAREGGGAAGVTTLPRGARASLEQMLQLANERGVAPAIFLQPMHPDLARELAPLGRDEHLRTVRRYLRSLEGRYRFSWRDYSDVRTVGGETAHWYDGAHPQKYVTDLVLQRVHRDMPLPRPAKGRR